MFCSLFQCTTCFPLLSFAEFWMVRILQNYQPHAPLSRFLKTSTLTPLPCPTPYPVLSSLVFPFHNPSPYHSSGDRFSSGASRRTWINGRTRSQFGPIAWNAICGDIRWISPGLSTCDVSAEFRIRHNTDALIVCCSAPLSTRSYTFVIRGIDLLRGSTAHAFAGSNECREKGEEEY
jgi:hypothetical protein